MTDWNIKVGALPTNCYKAFSAQGHNGGRAAPTNQVLLWWFSEDVNKLTDLVGSIVFCARPTELGPG